jgi:hypothetical protein
VITPPGRAAPRGIRSSLFVFPSDLVDEGVDRVLARVRERGVDAVTLAVAYHQARDLTPRSPLRRLVYRQDGVFVPLLKGPHVVRSSARHQAARSRTTTATATTHQRAPVTQSRGERVAGLHRSSD